MKKIYKLILKFLSNHTKLNVFLMAIQVIISGMIIFQTNTYIMIGTAFVSSLYCGFRLITFLCGKIPFFVSDRHLNALELKYGEEAEKIYKKRSLKFASIAYIIACLSFFIGILMEIV